MRIVSRKELMALPSGTVFSRYQPHVINGLLVTGGVCGSDFLECSLLDDFNEESSDANVAADALERGEDVPLVFGEVFGREGLFDDSLLYAVWSNDDVRGLAKFLAATAEAGGG
jgi:hypothetical protein